MRCLSLIKGTVRKYGRGKEARLHILNRTGRTILFHASRSTGWVFSGTYEIAVNSENCSYRMAIRSGADGRSERRTGNRTDDDHGYQYRSSPSLVALWTVQDHFGKLRQQLPKGIVNWQSVRRCTRSSFHAYFQRDYGVWDAASRITSEYMNVDVVLVQRTQSSIVVYGRTVARI